MQFDKNTSTSDIYDNYIKTDSVVIPYDNNFDYLIPTGASDCDVVYFQSGVLKGLLKYEMKNSNLLVTIAGHLDKSLNGKNIEYIAANSITRGYSYSGSGLPYPNPEIAYDSTPNKGSVVIDNEGDFKFQIEYPNAYYVKQGTILLNPHVHMYSKSEGLLFTIDVGRPVQNRSLTGLENRYNRTTGRM